MDKEQSDTVAQKLDRMIELLEALDENVFNLRQRVERLEPEPVKREGGMVRGF